MRLNKARFYFTTIEGYYYKGERPKITQSVLEAMLKNVIYVGQMNCNGIIYQGKHPPLVSRDIFDKAQLAFLKVDKSKVRKNFDFLYPGIVKCGVCGYSFCGERQKNVISTIAALILTEVVLIQHIFQRNSLLSHLECI